ncbi:nitroreductase [Nitzschia inconspicua]|uniref:Nitroreductase n=1 Tax=Nitzschia inconspicua TaxID=303405 RepID=A0A9K3L3H1_9STRA|nr:nitroreductase [Nitzschia inconspicua]
MDRSPSTNRWSAKSPPGQSKRNKVAVRSFTTMNLLETYKSATILVGMMMAYHVAISNIFILTGPVHGYTPSFPLKIRTFTPINPRLRSQAESILTFDEAVSQRFACTRYQRYDNINTTTTTSASPPDPYILKQARKVLEMSRRAPSGFNAQPYKLLVVSSPDSKMKLSKYCIGHNAHRVRDSDCTVLFLADRQVMRQWSDYHKYLLSSKKLSTVKLLKLRLLIGMFSSGLPLPYIISGPISFAFRFAMRILSWILCRPVKVVLKLPTLSSSQTWSEKNTMLVAMSYLLGCASRGIATTPMEGHMSWGIRQAFGIPRRYTIPLIVATGRPFVRNDTLAVGKDDAGLTHGNTKETNSPRFPSNITIFENNFGDPCSSIIEM